MKKLYGIQYLRAIAAIGVVIFHAAERSGGHFVIGAAGVDVFFVISGFIMWVIAETRPVSPSGFFAGRIRRIVPAYWLATAAMVAGGLAGAFPNLTLTVGHVLGSFLFVPHRSPDGGEIWPVLVQGWTLNYEMFFYAVFALALAVPRSVRLEVLAAIFLFLAGIGIAFRFENPVLATYTNSALLEFLLGMFIGKCWLAGWTPSSRVGVALIGAAICGFAFVGTTYIGFNPFVLGPVAALFVIGTLAIESAGRMPQWKWAALLGDGSYAIYLWHTFAISVVAKLATLLHVPALLAIPASTAAGIALGLAMFESGRLATNWRLQRSLSRSQPST
jgi:exopolysaccharide production protein ExoZ